MQTCFNIYITGGIFFLSTPAYPAYNPNLRPALKFQDQDSLGKNFDKPAAEMEFKELIWCFKAYMILSMTGSSEMPQLQEIFKLLKEKFILKEDKIEINSFFMWGKRIVVKEYFIPKVTYEYIFENLHPAIVEIRDMRREMYKNSMKREGFWEYPFLVKLMSAIKKLNKPIKKLYEKTLFEKAYDERVNDEEWQDWIYENYGLASGTNYRPIKLFHTPSMLTVKDVTPIPANNAISSNNTARQNI